MSLGRGFSKAPDTTRSQLLNGSMPTVCQSVAAERYPQEHEKEASGAEQLPLKVVVVIKWFNTKTTAKPVLKHGLQAIPTPSPAQVACWLL